MSQEFKWIQLTEYVRDKEQLRFATDQLDKDPNIEYEVQSEVKIDNHNRPIEVWAVWRKMLLPKKSPAGRGDGEAGEG